MTDNLQPRVCARCGKTFVAVNPQQLYCHEPCRPIGKIPVGRECVYCDRAGTTRTDCRMCREEKGTYICTGLRAVYCADDPSCRFFKP